VGVIAACSGDCVGIVLTGAPVGRSSIFCVPTMAGVFVNTDVFVELSGTEVALALVVAGIDEATGRDVDGGVSSGVAGRGAAKIASSAATINTPPRLKNNKRREFFIKQFSQSVGRASGCATNQQKRE
jgi:hypothetical protein